VGHSPFQGARVGRTIRKVRLRQNNGVKFMGSGRNQRGVSLVEACIVVAISAIMVSAVAPGFGRFIDKQRLEGAASQLATDIQMARSESVMRNVGLRLSPQTQPFGTCYVVHTGGAADCRCNADGSSACTGDSVAIKTVVLAPADHVSLQSNVASILFDPLHGTSTPTGTLKLVAQSGLVMQHVVNVMGRVRTCTPSGPTAVSGHAEC
jgi:type IV fimbrial biogenesis protein FimT